MVAIHLEIDGLVFRKETRVSPFRIIGWDQFLFCLICGVRYKQQGRITGNHKERIEKVGKFEPVVKIFEK